MVTIISQILLWAMYAASYENLALNKSAWQQHNRQQHNWRQHNWQQHNWLQRKWRQNKWAYFPVWGAAKAVDGRYTDRSAEGNQCTVSGAYETTATWGVDLGSVVSISHINIFYMTNNAPSPTPFVGRFAGFFLYVSNTTSKDDGHLCFHEIQNVTGTPTENQTINCSVHGRYVIYYNERRPGVTYPSYYSKYAYNELCEVEVQGCPDPTYYGVNCDQHCPDKCQAKRCHISTGDCLGCIPGYRGIRCSKVCDVHAYGLGCSSWCGNCSDGETCHHVNGTCLKGCSEGVEGEKCQTQCQPGFYGKNCGQRCSWNCKVTNRCNRFTGECDGGCKPGWKAPKCQQDCDGGMYGANCTQSCGSCLDNKQCHHGNGTCLNGCSSGYQGGQCKKTCTSGYFGIHCENICTVYCGGNGSCDPITGICDRGCKEGWSGIKCGTEALSSCSACSTDDNTTTIISLVVSVLIVLIASVVNFLIWKRNQPENTKTRENSKSESNTVHSTDTPNSTNRVQSTYADLGNLDKPSTYEDLHRYAEVGGEI